MKKIPDVQATGIHVAVPVAFHRLPREPVSRHATLVKSLELIAN